MILPIEQIKEIFSKVRPLMDSGELQQALNLIPDPLFWGMCNAGLSLPFSPTVDRIAFSEDLDASFDSWVYDRWFGLFYVEPSKHFLALSFLYRIHKDKAWGGPCLPSTDVLSEKYLEEVPGTFSLSSVSRRVICHKRSCLSYGEKVLLNAAGRDLMEIG